MARGAIEPWMLALLLGAGVAWVRAEAAEGLTGPEPASNAGTTVAVVFNAQQPESRELANYYASRRQVPTNQVFGYALPVTETMTRAQFRDLLEQPLLRSLEEGGLLRLKGNTPEIESSRIRYLVLCHGVPVKITADASLSEAGAESLPAPLRRNGAAVDSELALLPRIHGKLPLTGTVSNPVYAITNHADIGPGSGVLMVARLDGPEVGVARRLVDQALEAERLGLWGRAYLDLRGLTNRDYQLGDQWIRGSAELLRQAGFETVVDTNAPTFSAAFPMSHIAFYAGWYDGAASGPFARPSVEFMPGAFAYHLHSFSAQVLRSATAGWAGPLLHRGAAATVGYVEEPYLQATLDCPAFFARWVFGGFTFGEAVYAALPALSWQATVVGDPLYRPFGRASSSEPIGRRFQELHMRLLSETNALIEWSHLQVVNLGLNAGSGLTRPEVVRYLEENGTGLRSAVLCEKLGDLLMTDGKFLPAVKAYSKALEFHPSPRQKLRLLLASAGLREVFTQESAALDHYQTILTDYPDYADRLSILRKAHGLARSLQRAELAAQLEREIQRLTAPKQTPPAAQR